MLRIGEFSALSTISIHMLRHYDKIGLLIPQHVDENNGYRYYDKKQLYNANQIISLKAMGFGLDEIREILLIDSTNLELLLHVKLDSKLKELERLQEQIRQIQIRIDTDKTSEIYVRSIARKTFPPMWIVSFRGYIHTYSDEGILWQNLDEECQRQNIKVSPTAPAMAIYHDKDENSEMLDVEVQLPIDKNYKVRDRITVSHLPERDVVSVIFNGSYLQIANINIVVAEWLEKNQLEITDQTFSIYHLSPGNCNNDDDFITELCFSLKTY